jgi:hypothetical protein
LGKFPTFRRTWLHNASTVTHCRITRALV